MKKLQDIIEDLRTCATSCDEEASGKLEGDRSEGLTCIADHLHTAVSDLKRLKKKACILTPKQRAALIDLAGNAERDDLIAALSNNDYTIHQLCKE
jgi:hypothetical protein